MHRCNVNVVAGCIAIACMPLLDACTESPGPGPMVPTIQAIPGRGKSFWSFYEDRAFCRRSAYKAVRDQARRANLQVAGYAPPATGLGAGPSIGRGQGASGTLGGAGRGALQSWNAQVVQAQAQMVQAQYDSAFAQCMVSLGNSLPGAVARGP